MSELTVTSTALTSQELAEITAQLEADLAAEIAAGGVVLEPTRWRLMGGGVAGFVNVIDETQITQTITGVILAYQRNRVLFDPSTPEGQKAVVLCRSGDAKIGQPQAVMSAFNGSMADQECASCVFNRWGSGKGGRGKACREKEALVVMPEGDDIDPLVVFAPPTSLTPFAAFKNQLATGNHPASRRLFADNPPAWAKGRGGKRGVTTWYVVTRISTEKVGQGQSAFSKMVFSPIALVSDEMAVSISEIRKDWGVHVARVEADMYAEMAAEEAGQPFDDDPGAPF